MAATGQKELRINVTAQDKASGILNKIQSAISNVAEGAKKTASAFINTKTATTALGTALGFSMVGAVNAVKQQLSEAKDMALDFETSMAKTNTILKLTPDALKDFGREIDNISTRLPVSSQELADASYYIASAGVSAQNSAALLELSAQVAVGAMTDTTTAFDGIIAVVKGYGLNLTEATNVADMFFATNKLGYTTVGEIADAIQKVATKANAAGLSLQELMAVYATFTGVTGNADIVTTQLQGAIAALASPTKEVREKFDQLGISYGKAAIEEKGFAGVAKEVYDAVDGDTVALRELIPEKEALTLITALATTQFDKYKTSVDAVTNSEGALAEAVAIMSQTTETKLALMQNKVDVWKKGVGKALLYIESLAIDFGYTIVGFVEVTVAGFSYLGIAIQSAINLAAKVLGGFITNFSAMASDVYQIAKNIAANIKAAFTGDEFVPITQGTTAFKEALSEVANEMSGPLEDAKNLFTTGVNNLNGLSANTAQAVEILSENLTSAADGADSASSSFGGFADSTSSAADQAKKLQENIDKLGDAYDKVEETATDALENVKRKTEETLGDLDKKITDIYSKMEDANAQFMKGQAQSNDDLAQAYVEQEDKVSSLLDSIKEKQQNIKDLQDEMAQQGASGSDTSGTQQQITNEQADLADVQAQYDKELEALNAFADQAKEIQDQIDEAKRRASLTDFERTVEDINKEKEERQKAFDEKMLQLANELIALQDQKAKIVALEQETTNTINALRTQAAALYEDLLSGMATATEEEVKKMIDALQALQDQTGAAGGETLNNSISDILGGGTGATTNNISINISSLPADVSAEEVAQMVIDQLTREVQTSTLASST